MSDKTLVGARGLNSIADPSSFRGATARSAKPATEEEPEIIEKPARAKVDAVESETVSTEQRPQTSKKTRTAPKASQPNSSTEGTTDRKRRELSIPLPIHELVTETRQNPTDIVMRALRNFSEEIAAGDFARGVHRGRKRLRLSVTDKEFQAITKLGNTRGWNRSETVAVLIEAELTKSKEQIEPHLSAFPI